MGLARNLNNLWPTTRLGGVTSEVAFQETLDGEVAHGILRLLGFNDTVLVGHHLICTRSSTS